jgi:RNA polymerase sigma factor (sigma-70 family)
MLATATKTLQPKRLSRTRERELTSELCRGDIEARTELIMSHMGLIHSIAKQYQGRGVSTEDLVHEGVVGLMRAMEDFDPEVGTRLATYAQNWIRNTIQQAVERNGGVCKVPHHTGKLICKWQRTAISLQAELNRRPMTTEIAARVGYTEHQTRRVVNAINNKRIVEIAPEDIGTSGDVCDEIIRRKERRKANEFVMRALGHLTVEERLIIKHEFGLDGHTPMDATEMARYLDIKPERLKRLRESAVQKLHKMK